MKILLLILAATSGLFAKWDDVKSLKPGTPVSIRSGFLWESGELASATDDEVVVLLSPGSITIPRAKVNEVLILLSPKQKAVRGLRNALIFGGVFGGGVAVASGITGLSATQNALIVGGTSAGAGFATGYFGSPTRRIFRQP